MIWPAGHQGYEGASVILATTIDAWNRADVREGIPQVYAATSESFVAQMLNLDLLGAISFDKGCYTGQEVVARAHYRGRVKRRMQRWHNANATELKPGDNARGPDGRSLAVVRTGPHDSQGPELLAVGTFGIGDANAPASTAADSELVTVSGPLPLPYSLPE
jgi:folate-binding protein YgfZ